MAKPRNSDSGTFPIIQLVYEYDNAFSTFFYRAVAGPRGSGCAHCGRAAKKQYAFAVARRYRGLFDWRRAWGRFARVFRVCGPV